MLAALRSIQRSQYGKTMAIYLPGNTRWLSVYATVASIVRSHRAIAILALESHDSDFVRLVNDVAFWEKCEQVVPVLRSCALAILALESDLACIGQSFNSMTITGATIEKFPGPERSLLMQLFANRFKFVYNAAMVTASRVIEKFLKSRCNGHVQNCIVIRSTLDPLGILTTGVAKQHWILQNGGDAVLTGGLRSPSDSSDKCRN